MMPTIPGRMYRSATDWVCCVAPGVAVGTSSTENEVNAWEGQ